MHKTLFLVCGILLMSCSQDNNDAPVTAKIETTPTPRVSEEFVSTTLNENNSDSRQFNIGNTQYLFDVSDNSPEELEALLQRAEEIRETNAEGYDDLEIVLVLHGPDINIFRQQNYAKHKPLVDLAAKLDAFDIIDMKICETSMSYMGVERSEVPAFIESVPFAPDEIRRLNAEGYIQL